jgi:hypothetical protein
MSEENMAFYHDLITEKSWQILQDLRRKYKFILIGGWAVFLYTKSLKSKDIDLICDYKELEKFKREFDLSKNLRLKKYEIKIDGIDIDIYLPYFSDLGIPVEEISNFIQNVQNFVVVKPEILIILKQKVYQERAGSIKGEKDKIDIVSLLTLPEFDFNFYLSALKKYKLETFRDALIILLKNIRQLPELNLNEHRFAKFRESIFKKLNIRN